MGFSWTSPRPGDGDRVGHFHSSIVVAVVSVPAVVSVALIIGVTPVAEVAQRTALAYGFVDGCARATPEYAQDTARATLCIVCVTAAGGTGAVR